MAKKNPTISGVSLLFSEKEKIQGALLKFNDEFVFYLLRGHNRKIPLKTLEQWLKIAKKIKKKNNNV